MSKFSKVAWYKINMQKSGAFLYANNKLSEKEIKKTILLTIGSILSFHLTEYCEIFPVLMPA